VNGVDDFAHAGDGRPTAINEILKRRVMARRFIEGEHGRQLPESADQSDGDYPLVGRSLPSSRRRYRS
jgi:hypothetical protein